MEWCQEFESGLPEIDDQHRVLFGLIQHAHEVDVQTSRASCRPVLIELERVAGDQFACEERLMVECGYPATERHVAEHAKLLLEAHSYQDNVLFSARKLNLVLSNWLMSHTMLEDRPLAQHVLRLRANGGALSLGMDLARTVEVATPSAIHSKVGREDDDASGQ